VHELYIILSMALAVVVLILLLLIVAFSVRNGITPMPTSRSVRQMVMQQIDQVPEGTQMIEAGSGFGTLAIQLARRFPLSQVIGVENSIVPVWSSRFLAWTNRLPASRLTFRRTDLFDYPYEEADLIVCYLHPAAMRRLRPILQERAKNGTRVVSVFFAFDHWEPTSVEICRDLYRTKVYMYHVGKSHRLDVQI